MTMRSHAEVVGFFDGSNWSIRGGVHAALAPGVPDDVDEHPERFSGWAGVGRKA